MQKFKFEFVATTRGHGVVTAETEDDAYDQIAANIEKYTKREDFEVSFN